MPTVEKQIPVDQTVFTTQDGISWELAIWDRNEDGGPDGFEDAKGWVDGTWRLVVAQVNPTGLTISEAVAATTEMIPYGLYGGTAIYIREVLETRGPGLVDECKQAMRNARDELNSLNLG